MTAQKSKKLFLIAKVELITLVSVMGFYAMNPLYTAIWILMEGDGQ